MIEEHLAGQHERAEHGDHDRRVPLVFRGERTPLRPAPLEDGGRRYRSVTVRDAMTTIVVTVSFDDALRNAARRMTGHGVGAAVVADDGGRMQAGFSEQGAAQGS